MIVYLNRVTNPAAPWSMIDDTAENILNDMEQYTLDPTFEFYGNFVNSSPKWRKDELAARYADCAVIFGNFLNYTHAFRLVTDDAALIDRIKAAVVKNKARPEYIAAFEQMVAKLPVLTKANAKEGKFYAHAGGWLKVTRIYRISEAEANEKALLYLDHYEGVTRDGHAIGGALPGGDTLSTTKHWKI